MNITITSAPAPAFNWKEFKAATLAKGKLPYAIWYAKSGVECYVCTDDSDLNSVINDCRAGASIMEESYFECYVDSSGKFYSEKSRWCGVYRG